MNRRGFLKSLASAAAIAAVPVIATATILKKRVLTAKWSVETSKEVEMMFDQDAVDHLSSILAKEMAKDQDRKIVKMLS